MNKKYFKQVNPFIVPTTGENPSKNTSDWQARRRTNTALHT